MTHPLESDSSGGQRYLAFEQLGPDVYGENREVSICCLNRRGHIHKPNMTQKDNQQKAREYECMQVERKNDQS